MIARIETHPTRVRLLLQHDRKDRLIAAYREAIRGVTLAHISVAELEPEYQRWWIGGRRCWIFRAWLIAHPPEEFPVVFAEELRRVGFRVSAGRAGRDRMIGCE